MEENMNVGASVAPITEKDKQSNTNGLKIIAAIACIAAACGISFGVYGMMQSSEKDSQISDLKTQIKDGNETTMVTTDATKIDGGPYIENGYFYVPRWGVKYKLSDNLINYGYAVDQNNQGDSYGDYVVGLSAIFKSDYNENPQTQYYDDIFSCSQITIREVEDSKQKWHGSNVTPDVQFNGHDFIIHDTWRQMDCAHVGSLAQESSELVDQLREILLNPEEI